METLNTEWTSIDIERGLHIDRDDGVCAMELVAWMAGEPHTDTPECASQTITLFIQRWNDDLRSNNEREILRPVLPLVVNSYSKEQTGEVELTRSNLCYEWVIRQNLASWLALSPKLRETAALIASCDPSSKYLSELISEALYRAREAVSGSKFAVQPYAACEAQTLEEERAIMYTYIQAKEAVLASGTNAALETRLNQNEDRSIINDILEAAIDAASAAIYDNFLVNKTFPLSGNVLEHVVRQLQQSGIELLKTIADTSSMIAIANTSATGDAQ